MSMCRVFSCVVEIAFILIHKRNEFESVVVRWVNLEPTIQSEVSQTEKSTYCILMHIYGIWKDGTHDSTCRAAKETFCTPWGKERAG